VIEGPYHNNSWRDRLARWDGVLGFVQTIIVLAGAATLGAHWILEGQYLRFALVFGAGAVLVFAFFRTRAPLFVVLLVVLAAGAGVLAGV
jgi:hypothetical protein